MHGVDRYGEKIEPLGLFSARVDRHGEEIEPLG